MIYGRVLYRKIVHPLQWTRVAVKLEGLTSQQQKTTLQSEEDGEP